MDFDGPYKTLFSNPAMIEDLIKNFVHEDWVETLNFNTLALMNSSFIGDHMERREGDLIFRINTNDGDPTYILVLLELQSSSDHWMSVRFLVYAGLLYQQLIKDKQVTKKGKLPPVFPLVLYNGKGSWQASTRLKKLIDLPPRSKLFCFNRIS